MQDPWLEQWRQPLAAQPHALAALMRLRWAVGSAPLMAHHPDLGYQVLDDAWFQDALTADADLFDDWAEAIAGGDMQLPDEVLHPDGQLLGKHFEALIACWLDASPHFALRAHGQQLKEDGRTVGELDFIVDDLRRGRILHLEVASKFYLAAEDGTAWENWVGPSGRHDTLRVKMDKLVTQLAATRTPTGRAFLQGERIPTPEPVLLMKGWFFHHYSRLHRHKPPRWAHPGYNAGWWCRPDEAFEVMGSDSVRILPLPKGRWLGRFHPGGGDPPLHWTRLEQVLHDHFGRTRRALMCAVVIEGDTGWEEISRGFVVHPDWPDLRR